MALETKLPDDAVFEILTRSSLETLGRCRSISKEWNRVTYESTFHQLLCERSRIVSGFFIESLDNSQLSSTFVSLDTDANSTSALSLDFLKDPIRIEAANQGLLVCVNQKDRYLVCKPTTKQWVKIPNPKTKYFTASTSLLVLKSNPLKYKIIRFSKPKEQLVKRNSEYWRHLRCEIFDSTTWAWKRLKDVILPCTTFFANKEDSVVAANGGLHWLLSDNQVFAFYEDAENWEMFSLPPSAVNNGDHKSKPLLAEYQGRLAVIRSGEEFMDMWVMEDYGRKLWSATRSWNIKKLYEEQTYPSPLAFHNGEAALFMAALNNVIFYNFQEGKSHQIRLQHPPIRIFKFQSDMEEVNLERPDRVLKQQSNSEEVNMENHPEDVRGLTKLLLPFKGFKPYLFLVLAPMLGVLYRCCSDA